MSTLQRRQRQEQAAADKAIAEAETALQRRAETEHSDQGELRSQLGADLRELRARRGTLEAGLDALNRQIETGGTMLAAATQAADAAAAEADTARRASQMHRPARFFFGKDDNATAARGLTWFSIVTAGALATAGTMLAALHFRILTQQPPARRTESPLARALRSWVARQRKKHSVVKTIEVVREVEVPVDRIVQQRVEVAVPEPVLVPVPLEASEDERRRIMAQARGIGRGAPPEIMSRSHVLLQDA